MTGHPRPLALTMGDPAGIGPDIALLAYARRKEFDLPPFYLHGDVNVLRARAHLLNLDIAMADTAPDVAVEKFPSHLPVCGLSSALTVTAGQPDVKSASGTIESIQQAVRDVHAGRADAVVTNPIAKDVLYAAGFSHPGHTEFLGTLAHELWAQKARPVMMLACETLRVVPVTIHIPLRDVPASLTPDLLQETIQIVLSALREDFNLPHPRVVCTGLNPHAGENGSIGTEDRDIIAPVIETLRHDGHDVKGPFPGDTLFHAQARATYDCAVAMYHDQALIPIKTLAFDRGVNVTLGLPFVRTSPDHGTAFGIAGSGKANPRSLIEALHMARQMADARQRGNVS